MNRALGGRPAWSFCLLPGLYSSALYWGFFNFIVCVPLMLGLVWVAVGYAAAPTRRTATGLAIFGCLLAAAFCGAVGLAVSGLAAWRRRESLRVVWPFLAPAPIAATWMWLTSTNETQTAEPTAWANVVTRLADLPPNLTMIADRSLGTALAALAVATPFLLGARPRRDAARWAPFAITVSIFLVFPQRTFGTDFIHNRFAVLILPFLLLGLEPWAAPTRLPIGPIVAGATAALVLLLHSLAWLGFAREARTADVVLAQIPKGRRVLSAGIDPLSDFVPLPVFAHYAQWYVAERGGYVDFSFASYYPELIRFRPETLPAAPDGMKASVGLASTNLGHRVAYDYRLLRGGDQLEHDLIAARLLPLVAARSGPWWLLKLPSAR
jgi:hypothetical protein